MPANATNRTVTWSVTNGTGAATISNTGLLKAVSDGTVTVRATANDGSGKYGEKVITISNQIPTIIYTSSTITNGAVDPSIVVNLINDTFTADVVSNLPANWTSSSGTTGLAVGTVTRNNNTQMTFQLTGTAYPGILTLKAKAAALTGDNESNTITVLVLPASSGATGTIELAETINGGENAEPDINGQSITFSGEVAYYIADENTIVPISANWIGVKITAPTGVTPDENAVLYINGRYLNRDEISGWSNIIEEGDGANYFYLYQRITDLSRVYNIAIKWNNEITEAYSINFAPSATLEQKRGTIARAEKFNGGASATTTIAGRDIRFNGEIEYITADESNGLPISGNWVGVKITAPEGVYPDENAVLTAHGINCNIGGVPGWDNIREEGDGDNYFYLYQRVRVTAYAYEVEIKWNNECTETYLIIIPGTTTLEYSDSELTKLENMITFAQANYDTAVSDGIINPDDIAEFGGAIAAAAAVRDNTEATMPQIYAAQIDLEAAMDIFETVAQPVGQGIIERAETINGGESATTTTAGRDITFNGEIGYIVADESNGLPISGNWVGVKITAPEGVYPDENAVLTAHGINCNRDGAPGWDNIREEGDGDNYFYLYQRVRKTAYVYEVVIKWNNECTETYLIIIPGTTTLEYSGSELTKLGDMITFAQNNYDAAVSDGIINPDDIAEFGGAIAAAEAVRDNIDATMPQIYDAQIELEAAMDKFEAVKLVQQEANKITVEALGTITTSDTQTILEKAQALISAGYTVTVKEADGSKIGAEGAALEAGEGTISFTVTEVSEPSNTADTATLNITVQ